MTGPATTLAGLSFQNPIMLAAGTAAFGRELDDVCDLDALGGFVTKAVSLQPRPGAPAPRVGEFPAGMINAIGLANPGLEAVRREEFPWLSAHIRRARVFVNVIGTAIEDFGEVIRGLDDLAVVAGYELNVSCPNVKAGGMEFGADREVLAALVRGARAATRKPIAVKLSPVSADIVGAAQCAADAGADAITLTNTIPGLVIDVARRRPVIGFGSGGVSGPPLLPVGVLATWKVWRATRLPIIGLGGVSRGAHAVQYLLAGASVVGIGTAGMVDPRAPERVVRELAAWCAGQGVRSVEEIRGTLEWPQ